MSICHCVDSQDTIDVEKLKSENEEYRILLHHAANIINKMADMCYGDTQSALAWMTDIRRTLSRAK
jgi:hypothetical protein